ncbi:MAG: hypothetical protein JWM55_1412 [Acidimicrobiaceae bacterium]|nr:hypothetical protein [Acidimicrobiaceae bacterium]
MHLDSPLEAPQDRPERWSAGIRGPYQIPVDDEDPGVEVADSTITELEDGFSFGLDEPQPADHLVDRGEVAGSDVLADASNLGATRSFLESHWLVGQGETSSTMSPEILVSVETPHQYSKPYSTPEMTRSDQAGPREDRDEMRNA